jgi:RNA polymerase sigma-70 factor (ECF subfamily)
MGSAPEGMTISLSPTDPAALREQDLLRRVQAGQKEYFYDLVKPYQRRVYSAALSILRNEAEAEDAAQEAFLKALTHIQQFRAEARFSTWLIQIAVNEALMRKRKAHAEIMEPIGEREEEDGSYTPRDFADWREIPSESLERKEIRNRLAGAVAALAEKYRQVFVLRAVQHMSIQETAEALGI